MSILTMTITFIVTLTAISTALLFAGSCSRKHTKKNTTSTTWIILDGEYLTFTKEEE